MIFQDFSAAVLCRRKRFDGVKRCLKSIGVDYKQVYPASLKVTHHGSTKVFQDPALVEQFINSLAVIPAEDEWSLDRLKFYFSTYFATRWA